jgi:hypothetical protein
MGIQTVQPACLSATLRRFDAAQMAAPPSVECKHQSDFSQTGQGRDLLTRNQALREFIAVPPA